jgi:hypothetical protein
MKIKIALIVGIILCGLILLSIGVFFLINNVLNIFQNAPAPTLDLTASPTSTSALPSTPLSATPTWTAASTLPAPSLTAASPASPPVSAPYPSVALSPTPVQSSAVSFEILSVEGSGFSRTVTGKLTNTGSADLHNSKLKIEMYSNGKLIKNDSQSYVEKSFNTLKAGLAIVDVVSIKIGLIDGLSVQKNGVTFLLTFTSDEKTQTFTYDYQP